MLQKCKVLDMEYTNRNRLPRSVNLVQKTKKYLQLWENYDKT